MESFWAIAAVIIGYVFGSIPFALVIGLLFYKKDIRQYGSGNLGGSNAGRVLGGKAGASVTVLDALKAFFAMTLFYFLKQPDWIILLAGLATTIGHAFPLFAKFKGGKSVATYFGFLLGISVYLIQSYWLFLIALVIYFGLLYLFKMSSLASMSAVSLSSLLSLLFAGERYWISLALIVVAGFIVYRHRSNIKRILAGNESKITWM